MRNLVDTVQADENNAPTLQPMGFGEILDTIFSLYRKHFLLFLGVIAVDFCGNLVTYLLARFLPNFPLKGLVMDLVGMSFGLVSMGGIIVTTATVYLGKRIRYLDALRQAGHRFWQTLVCHLPWNLVSGIPRLGIIVLLLLIFRANMELRSAMFTVVLLVTVPFSFHLPIDLGSIINGLLISMIPLGHIWIRFIPLILAPLAVYFTVRWLFAVVVVLLERPLIRHAFSRSHALTRGSWWRIWGTLISLSVLSFAIQRIVVITIGYILMLTKVMGETTSTDILKWIVRYGFENSNPLFYAIMGWINWIVGSFVFAIWIIGVTLLYFDLRIRKDGFDLEMQVNNATAMPTRIH